jgi:hypothetical protein
LAKIRDLSDDEHLVQSPFPSGQKS